MSPDLRDAGGAVVVMPHTDPRVISAAKAAGMACLPGVATPSEAFAALRAGADALKLFPAETLGPAAVKAWRAVLPADVALLPVGGITPDNMGPWRLAGAAGFGLGSALYRPGASVAQVSEAARPLRRRLASSEFRVDVGLGGTARMGHRTFLGRAYRLRVLPQGAGIVVRSTRLPGGAT